jgi:hypothetical protein
VIQVADAINHSGLHVLNLGNGIIIYRDHINQMHQTIAFFGLGGNQISDDGATAIADALKSNQTLGKLHLGNNPMTSSILACLIYAFD